MKQLTSSSSASANALEFSEDDDNGSSGHSAPLPSTTSDKVGLPRMLSQRIMMGEGGGSGGDRKTLLKSSDTNNSSKRSLLTKGLSRSMLKLKNTVKQMGDNDDNNNEEDDEQVIPLMEYEMLNARFHVSEGVVLQQKEEIEQLRLQLNEKDDVIDSLMQKLEAMSTTATTTSSTPQRSKGPPNKLQNNKRMSSLDEKRMKKRQMERAHQLGLNRSASSLQKINLHTSLESALSFEQNQNNEIWQIGNPSTAGGTDPIINDPLPGTMIRVSSKASLPDVLEHSQSSSHLQQQSLPRSPRSGGRKTLMGSKQGSNRNFRQKNALLEAHLHNSGTSLSASENSQHRTQHSPRQVEQRKQANDGRISPKPEGRISPKPEGRISPKPLGDESPSSGRRRERHLSNQSSKRNFRRKNEVEHADDAIMSSEQHLTPASEGPREVTTSRSKSPHRRGNERIRPKRTNRRQYSVERFHNSAGGGGGTSSDDSMDWSHNTGTPRSDKRVLTSSAMAMEDSKRGRTYSKSPHRKPLPNKQSSKRSLQTTTTTTKSEPAEPQTSVTDYNSTISNSPRSRRSKVRQSSKGGPSRRRSDDTPPDAKQNFRKNAQARSAKAREGMTKPNNEMPDSVQILPASMKYFKLDQNAGNNNFFNKFHDMDQANPNPKATASETGGFLVTFGDSPFDTVKMEEQDHQPESSSGNKEEGKIPTTQDSSQNANGASTTTTATTVNDEKKTTESNQDNTVTDLGFSMMSMNELPENAFKADSEPMPNVSTGSTDWLDLDAAANESGKMIEAKQASSSEQKEHASDSNAKEGIEAKPEPPAVEVPYSSPEVTQDRKHKRHSADGGRDYLLRMNRNETLGGGGDSAVGATITGAESSRSRSLSPQLLSPRTPPGRKKLRVNKKSPKKEPNNNAKKEPNLNKDFLKAAFQKNVKKFVKLNDQFQQQELPNLEKEKSVDMRSISTSFSTLDELLPIVAESKMDEIEFSPTSETTELTKVQIPPPPPTSALSPPLTVENRKTKKAKTVHWELEQNLFRLLFIPVYDTQQKKDCFYNDAEIKQMRFELFMEQHAADMDIDSVEDEMMADDILDDMSFADEIVSDEEISIDIGPLSRRGSM